MKYKFVSEADNHFIVHDGKSDFPIAKAGLDEGTLAKIKALPKKFAEGGRAELPGYSTEELISDAANQGSDEQEESPSFALAAKALKRPRLPVPDPEQEMGQSEGSQYMPIGWHPPMAWPSQTEAGPEQAGVNDANFFPTGEKLAVEPQKYKAESPEQTKAADKLKAAIEAYNKTSKTGGFKEEEIPQSPFKTTEPFAVDTSITPQGAPQNPLNLEMPPSMEQRAPEFPELGGNMQQAGSNAGLIATTLPKQTITGETAQGKGLAEEKGQPAYLRQTQQYAKGLANQQAGASRELAGPPAEEAQPSFNAMNLMEYPQQIMNAYDQINKGYQTAAEAEGQKSRAAANAYNNAYAGLDMANQMMQFHFKNLDDENAELKTRVMNGTIDPFRVFHKSTANNIIAGISVLLGGLSQGLTGARTNPAIDVINNIVEKDMEKQRAELGKNMNLLSMNMAKYNNVAQATMATKANMLSMLDAQLAKSAAESGSPQAEAAYQVQSGQIKNMMLQQMQPLAQMMMMRNIVTNPNGIPRTLVPMLDKDTQSKLVASPDGNNFFVANTPQSAERGNKLIEQYRFTEGLLNRAEQILSDPKYSYAKPILNANELAERKKLEELVMPNIEQVLNLSGFRGNVEKFLKSTTPDFNPFTITKDELLKVRMLKKAMQDQRNSFFQQNVPATAPAETVKGNVKLR
jgi:hypothetical protein